LEAQALKSKLDQREKDLTDAVSRYAKAENQLSDAKA